MENLNDRDLELVALGSSIGSNCVPCTAYHLKQCRKHGLTDRQIRAAVAMAEKVKSTPAKSVLSTVDRFLNSDEGSNDCAKDETCSCC